FPWYDWDGGFHLVACVLPVVHDTMYILPAEIWYWNGTAWTEVHRAGCDPANLQASVGYNAIYACRPTIGSDGEGNLWVAWEQFDSANVEPATNLLRGDVWLAGSSDGGATWTAKQITEPGTSVSHRFPCVVDGAVVIDDEKYVPVVYEVDQVAGFVVQGQGPATSNPICVQWVPADSLIIPGVSEERSRVPDRLELSATPNPFSGRTTLSYGVPKAGNVVLTLADVSGRPIGTLAAGRYDAGRYTVSLESSNLPAGVYFYTLTTESSSLTKKLTVAR
ncbi:MAG: T9SS type A sorting domain-containing protein, partial [candidate division WOR-3 bacterium]